MAFIQRYDTGEASTYEPWPARNSVTGLVCAVRRHRRLCAAAAVIGPLVLTRHLHLKWNAVVPETKAIAAPASATT